MKFKSLIDGFIFILLCWPNVALADEQKKPIEPTDNRVVNQRKEKPPIVDHFACSDYCPGPRNSYIVKVYKGVKDPDECRSLGGRPATYTGWGTFRICIADGGTGADSVPPNTPVEHAQ